MAIVCCICNKKQSGFLEDYQLSDERKDMRICATCWENLQTIDGGTDIESVSRSIRYFERILPPDTNPEAIKTINATVDGYYEKLAAAQPVVNQPVVNQSAPQMRPTTSQSTFNYNEPKASVKETLYGNIGDKIKTYAAVLFAIEAVLVVILSLFLIFSGDEVLIVVGICMLIFGLLFSFVSSWLLYAFGELVDKTSQNERNTREILAFLRENKKN